MAPHACPDVCLVPCLCFLVVLYDHVHGAKKKGVVAAAVEAGRSCSAPSCGPLKHSTTNALDANTHTQLSRVFRVTCCCRSLIDFNCTETCAACNISGAVSRLTHLANYFCLCAPSNIVGLDSTHPAVADVLASMVAIAFQFMFTRIPVIVVAEAQADHPLPPRSPTSQAPLSSCWLKPKASSGQPMSLSMSHAYRHSLLQYL